MLESAALLSAFAADIAFDYGLYRVYRLPRYPCAAAFSAAASLILAIALHGLSLTVKGIIFSQLIILAGYSDMETHQIPDALNLLTLLVCCISPNPLDSLGGFFTVSVPMLVLGLIFHGGVGGGDIKMMAACGAVLGPHGAIEGTVISCAALLVSAAAHFIRTKTIRRKNAMAPYFAVGCFIAYLLEHMG